MRAPAANLDRETVRYLCGLRQSGVQLGLDRMSRLVAALGNPQDSLPTVHVAGTNGKGSVAAMLESILRSARCRVGLYTSPHLIRLGERVQVDRQPLGNDALARHVGELRAVVETLVARHGPEARPSYFEFMTALAFGHFRASQCDVAVVEVGVGGRLDATNVLNPAVVAITSLGLDHCELLGHTIEAIAREKAGIIKRDRPVVIGRMPRPAEEVIRGFAAEQGAPVISVVEEFGSDLVRYPATNLAGDYQRSNAAVATLVARQLASRWHLTEAMIASGLRQVDWPGRWQQLSVGGRRVIVDASHNAEGAEALDRNLAQLRAESGRLPIVVIGVLGAARAKPLLEAVCRHAGEVRLVVPHQPRACGHEELQALVPPTYRGRVVRDTIDAVFPRAEACLPDVSAAEVVVVTGSIYLAGEALVRIDPARGPLESELQDF